MLIVCIGIYNRKALEIISIQALYVICHIRGMIYSKDIPILSFTLMITYIVT